MSNKETKGTVNNTQTFNATVESLFRGMDSYISAKTVVGEPTVVNDTIIIPLVDVSFGVAAGAFAKPEKTSAGGGMKGKLSPSAVVVIKDGATRIIPVKDQDTISKIINAAPGFIDSIMNMVKSKKDGADPDVEDAVNHAFEK